MHQTDERASGVSIARKPREKKVECEACALILSVAATVVDLAFRPAKVRNRWRFAAAASRHHAANADACQLQRRTQMPASSVRFVEMLLRTDNVFLNRV